ncbi:MAG TPA: PLP-dependent aminotransferase family protein [Candidatus Eisenbacteria bacterium]|nr:PLP-dependent aminotransferase family protein [Candidatus Eisenbacteria bacterium]
MLPPIRAPRIRRRDVYATLRGAVLDGVLHPGERLPSTRLAAKDYGVSRGMMEEAYAELVEEGLLERAVGRGTFVAARAVHLPDRRARALSLSRSALSPRGRSLVEDAACREPEALRPFNAGVADTREFPWRVWHRLQARASRDLAEAGLGFADPRGLPALRQAIARYLSAFRGLACAPDQVVVFNSSQQAIFAVATLLLDRGDQAWIEDPCYLGARAALDLAGVKAIPVPVDADGLRIDVGIRRAVRARLVYVTPSHQYPTGVTLALERRLALLDWAAGSRTWILEDDYDGEFRYTGRPLPPLASLGSRARVLYLGTLSKAMFVSLRLAYLVVPEALVEPVANLRTQLDGFTPALAQKTMTLFLDEGYFAPHLRRMRTIYGAKHAALVDGLAPLAPLGWTWSEQGAGFHLLVSHPDTRTVRATAAASRLDLARLARYRVRPGRGDGLLLRFGGLEMGAVKSGARALVRAAAASV